MRRLGCIVISTGDGPSRRRRRRYALPRAGGDRALRRGALAGHDRREARRLRAPFLAALGWFTIGGASRRTEGEGKVAESKRIYAFGKDADGVNRTEGNREHEVRSWAGRAPISPRWRIWGCRYLPGSRSRARPAPSTTPRAAFPEGLLDDIADAPCRSREVDGQASRRRRGPAAGVGAQRRPVLDAGHDGHHPQSRPQRRLRRAVSSPRRATSASRGTPTAASSRCSRRSCWTLEGDLFENAITAKKHGTRREERHRPRRRGPARPRRRIQGHRRRARVADAVPAARERGRTGGVPAGSRGAAAPLDRGGLQLVDEQARHRLPQALSHRRFLGTAVNVQSMVFGNKGDTSATGVAFTRDPADGRRRTSTATSSRTRRARTWWRASATRSRIAELKEVLPEAGRRARGGLRHRSSGTTATCATSSSRSSRASCGCSRPASASARRAPRSRSPSTWSSEGLITKQEAVLRDRPGAARPAPAPAVRLAGCLQRASRRA